MKAPSIKLSLQQSLDHLRLQLSRPDALLLLAVLGIVSGLLAGGVIIAFRMLIETAQATFLPGGVENYEVLPAYARIVLPLAGAVLIGGVFILFARGQYTVGVVHVMERLAYHQGHMTLRGLLMQFVGGAISIVSGNSVGREGPSVHLGAASSRMMYGSSASEVNPT